MSQELSVEKLPTIVEDGFAMLPAPMREENELERRRKFAEYIQFWMNENKQRNPREVQDRSRKHGPGISDALISKFMNKEKDECNAGSLAGLADGLNRPPDEVFLAWLGRIAPINTSEYKESDFAHLWQQCKDLPKAERKIYFRYVRMLVVDVFRVIDSLKPE